MGNKYDDIDELDGAESQSYALDAWRWIIKGVGQTFRDAKHFRESLDKYSISTGYDYQFVHNEPLRITVECLKLPCGWRIHASRSSVREELKIKNADLTHTCAVTMNENTHSKAKKRWIASVIREKIRLFPTAKPSDLVKEIHSEYHVLCNYHRVWRGKEQAREEIYGKDIYSYDEIRWYCSAILKSNPGSIAEYEVDPTNDRFKRVFISFRAWTDAFERGCRPLIFIDGAFLKNKYKGVLAAATAMDANNSLLVLGIAIISSETNDNWNWFFSKLRECVSRDKQYTIYSDRKEGILKGAEKYFPESHHAYCLRHLRDNFSKTVIFYTHFCILLDLPSGPAIRILYTCRLQVLPGVRKKKDWLDILEKTARTINPVTFNTCMQQMLNELPKAESFFRDADPSHWANTKFTGPRWGIMNNNAAESFNNWFEQARHLPIVGMLDTIRVRTMDKFNSRRQKGLRLQTVLTPKYEGLIKKNFDKGRKFTVSVATQFRYECRHENSLYEVNLEPSNYSCSCGRFQLRGYPCQHACASISIAGRAAHDYSSSYFYASTYRLTYTPFMYPLSTNDRPITTDESCRVKPPETKAQPGRRKTKRFPSLGENLTRPIKCGRCGGKGHNRRACKNAIPNCEDEVTASFIRFSYDNTMDYCISGAKLLHLLYSEHVIEYCIKKMMSTRDAITYMLLCYCSFCCIPIKNIFGI
jgi:zinc finger SWIM domain-containing protein 3